jgi:hypothetical protein
VALSGAVDSVTLHYRHANQAEPWRADAMKFEAGRRRGVIPAEYTDSPFPLQYYFELAAGTPPRAWLHPGFDSTWSNQPYVVVRRACHPEA